MVKDVSKADSGTGVFPWCEEVVSAARALCIVAMLGVLTVGMVGCGEQGPGGEGTGQPPGSAGQALTAEDIDDGAEKLWPDQKMCPVTRMGIKPDYHAEYNGKRVYFADKVAVRKFKKNPQRWIKLRERRKEGRKE